MSIQLSNSYLEKDAIRAPNYFNGRLLSAEDMSSERDALLRRLAQLGRAAGNGIAGGLDVSGDLGGSTATDPVVTVRAGLAINRLGQILELNQDVDVSLLEPAASSASTTTANAGAFGACQKLSTSAYAAGKGVYLLTLSPTQGREGRAMTSGLGNLTVCCGDKSVVDGLAFRLIRLDVPAADLNATQLRNRLAHRCFGTNDPSLAGFITDPYGTPPTSYGLIDGLRNGKLTDAEVPLALVHWVDGKGTQFIDPWSVRRRVVHPPLGSRFDPLLDERRSAEQEAMFAQFAAQLEDIPTSDRRNVVATEVFDYLPAAGVLPLAKSTNGFDYLKFFSGLTTRGLFRIEGARLRWLLRESLEFPPFDLTLSDAAKRVIFLYLVRENEQAGLGPNPPKPYLVFTSGQMPYFGDPRYNLSEWNFSNFVLSTATS